jgi:hypothetical protein
MRIFYIIHHGIFHMVFLNFNFKFKIILELLNHIKFFISKIFNQNLIFNMLYPNTYQINYLN